MTTSFVGRLAAARIGDTFNQYADSALRRDRLEWYLDKREHASLLLVAEAPGYRGTRISGIPLTSERQLTGTGPAEATATIVQAVLNELGIGGRRRPLERRADASGHRELKPAADAARDRSKRAFPRRAH